MSKYFLHLSIAEQIALAKRLGILIQAGVPIAQALLMLKKQVASKNSLYIIEHLHEQVEGGQFLSAGMGHFKSIFGEFAINIIRIGEISGTLAENLNYWAVELKKKQELKRKVISALVYPIFIVVATIGISTMLITYVFPKILPIFQSFKTRLPVSTRVLIFISNLFSRHWLYILGALLLVICATVFCLKTYRLRKVIDRNILRLPFLGKLFQSYQIVNLTRSLGLLLKSDVGIVEALKISAATTSNLAYKQQFMLLAETVARGEKISTAMEKHSLLFPALVCQMVAVGEATGNLSSSLLYLAEIYGDELNNLTQNLSAGIEPVLMIFMGLLVGFLAISIITPIYGITQSLHP